MVKTGSKQDVAKEVAGEATVQTVTWASASGSLATTVPLIPAMVVMVVTVVVTDNGHGMDHDTLTRIFEPFYTTKSIGKGTGLGLSLVKHIMEAHQGKIEVDSTPGQGSLFTLKFPLTKH